MRQFVVFYKNTGLISVVYRVEGLRIGEQIPCRPDQAYIETGLDENLFLHPDEHIVEQKQARQRTNTEMKERVRDILKRVESGELVHRDNDLLTKFQYLLE